MHPVSTHGAPKITMNSRDSDYEGKLRAAKAQADGNQFVMGVQDVLEEGPGQAIKGSRTAYGAPTVMPNELMQGNSSNFAQKSDTANAPLDNPENTTGNVALSTSSTEFADTDQETFQTDALERRLNMISRAAGNANNGLNDRSQMGRL